MLAGLAAAKKKKKKKGKTYYIWFVAASEYSHIVYCVGPLTGVAHPKKKRKKKWEHFYCYDSERFALFSTLTLFKLFQGGGQSAGDGPQQHLQEGKATGGEAG